MTYLVRAWFAADEAAARRAADRAAATRPAFDAMAPTSYASVTIGGIDWGLEVRHLVLTGGDEYLWPFLAESDGVTALSFGLPLGLDRSAGPTALAAGLLEGRDVLAGVTPPFGLLAVRDGHEVVVGQDWLGMCRTFVGERDGLTVIATRPGLVADMLGDRAADLDGWTSYAVCGHFGGNRSPWAGVRLLGGGERLHAARAPGGGWAVSTSHGVGLDEVVMSRREAPRDDLLDLAAESFVETSSGLASLWSGELRLGLSGGKDSRVIAASFVPSGVMPTLVTNEDTAAEGEVAAGLVHALRTVRGFDVTHLLVRSGAPEGVLRSGLRERVEALQHRYDFQFPSTFATRPAESALLPAAPWPASLTGAGGELATAYWYGAEDPATVGSGPEALVALAADRLLVATPRAVLVEAAYDQERDRLRGTVARGLDIGLVGLEVLDYVYLAERVRRWYTSAYHVGLVTPFLAADVVASTFALSVADKQARVLHAELLRRFAPEWSDIPFVTVNTGVSTASAIWDGDGLDVLCDLADSAHGRLPRLVSPGAVDAALVAAARGPGRGTARTLAQFAALAIAAETMEPGTSVAPTGVSRSRLATALSPPRRRSLPRRAAGRLRRLLAR